MKVNNKGGKGNPYHKESNGRFTSADGVGAASVEETEETKISGGEETVPAKKLPSFLKPKKELHKMLKPKGSVVSGGLEDALKRGLKNAENEEKRSKIDTLKNFKAVHDKNVRELKRSGRLVYFSEENIEKINNKIDELKTNSRLCTNARISVVPLILKYGQKNQFETGSSDGYQGPERLKFSQSKFGAPSWYNYGGEECFGLEKYGNIEHPNFYKAIRSTNCDQYGSMKLFYKRENVDWRTTLTIGDSLDNRYGMQPCLFTDKSDIAMWGEDYGYHDEEYIVSQILSAQSLHEVANILGRSYSEIQIHGDITPSDFEMATINDIYDFEMGFCDEAIFAAQELGIPVYCASIGQVYQVSVSRTASGEIERKKYLANL